MLFKLFFLNSILWTSSWLLLRCLFKETTQSVYGWSYNVSISYQNTIYCCTKLFDLETFAGYVLYLLSICINSRFFDQLAKETIHFTANRPAYYTNSVNNNRVMKTSWPSLSSSLYLIIFYGNCALLVNLIRLIPFAGTVIGFPMSSIIMAYYCFE